MSNNKKKNTKKSTNAEIEKTKKYKMKNSKKKNKGKKIWKKILLVMLIIFAIIALVGAAVVIGIFSSSKYKVTREDMSINHFNTIVLDSEGNTIATLNGNENRQWVSIDEMPEYLPKMFVALEDERFYSHNGVDLKRTIGATLGFVVGGGSSSYGGSTITQQLVKNTFEDDEQSGIAGVERKIREMARAMNVEKVLSKNEILELYLNKILMGGTYYGVGTAAQYYFNKDVNQLSIPECAFLVAINPAPNAYNPFDEEKDNTEKIKNKVKVVLAKFKEEAKGLDYDFTDEAYEAAVKEVEDGLKFEKGEVITSASTFSYHTAAAIEEVVAELAQEKGLTEKAASDMVYNNGYVIYSTEISSIQNAMESEYVKDKYVKSGRKKNSDGSLLNVQTQSAMVIIDHTTGYVVGAMGGLGTNSNAVGLNRAKRTKQPGSSIKTLSCLATGIEEGVITAATVYDDSTTNFGGGYIPHNSSHNSGLITVRTAMAESSNIVNCKILTNVGISKAMSYLKNFGITSIVSSSEDPSKNDESIASLALGGLTHGISPLEMAGAYATIANDGVYIEPTFFTKVEDADGNVILETKQETHRVLSTQTAYIVKNVLTSVVTGGTGSGAGISGMQVAGKTGSTDNYQNRWFCGFTPYYTAATWYGFDYNEDPTWSGNLAKTIWQAVMKNVHSGLKGASFERPSGIVTATICLDSGCVATESCTRTSVEYFVAGTVPKQCEGHTKLTICKTTGKIANEYCTDVEEKTFLVKPEKENTKAWATSDEGKYDVPTETCDVHKEPEKLMSEVPNVIGMTQEDAKKAIEAKNLKVEIVYEEDKSKEDGIVLKQSIEANKTVEQGTIITITVNKILPTGTNSDNSNNTVVPEPIENTTLTVDENL